MENVHGGPIEYVVAALLLLQFLVCRAFLRHKWPVWSRAVFAVALIALTLLWCISLTAFWLIWSGKLYNTNTVPVALRTAIVAVGYTQVLLCALVAAFRYAARLLVRKVPGLRSPARRRWMRAAGLVAAGAPVALASYGVFIERNRYGTAELDLPVENLHPDLEGYRIVQVSDLHVSPFLSPRQAGRAIDMANELHADLAVFTGDLISELGDPLDEAIRELIRLRGADGVLGCMGNHEQYVGCRNYLERQAAKAGVKFLRYGAVRIQRGQGTLNIVGVDFQRAAQRANYLPDTERFIIPGASNLLLSHNPDVFPTAIARGFQSVLSGHTHGGQVNVEILNRNINPARFKTPFTSGLYRQGSPGTPAGSCFVTNGIGTIGVPIRLGAPPEIALLRLRRA